MVDAEFADRRLTEIYDLLDPVRDDLDGYGRFLEPDSAGLVDGTNVYAYARHAPFARRDPWGLHLQRQPHRSIGSCTTR